METSPSQEERGGSLNTATPAAQEEGLSSQRTQHEAEGLTEPGVSPACSKADAETPRSAAKRGFIHRAVKEETGELVSDPHPRRQKELKLFTE